MQYRGQWGSEIRNFRVNGIQFDLITNDTKAFKKDKAEIKHRIAEAPTFWSDERDVHWQFDSKLSSGHWLEKVIINSDLTKGTAVVIY